MPAAKSQSRPGSTAATRTSTQAQSTVTGATTTTAATATSQPTPCPYHNPILQLQPHAGTIYGYGQGQTGLDRFMAEGPGEQYALFNRGDNGQTSLARGCTCAGNLQAYGYHLDFFDEVDNLGKGQ
ncbi:hypothetical protein SLS56_001984 [Neofusicoccum ribis]|uniref:Uncharacterized protein n=1 Tax=Neofusicoccum ribis TaxID=45134 RepID=A0ABR3T5S8_9PEZI